MTNSLTVVTEVSGQRALVTLNRPESLNAFNASQRSELLNAVRRVNDHNACRVVIITGGGRAFCAGADLSEQHPPGQTVEQRINNQYKPILVEIAESNKVWIAAVNGAAAGIGASLAMCCDLVVMDEAAYLYQAFAAVGLIPDGGASMLLQNHLGSKKAFEVLALGHKLTAQECVDYGLANRIARSGLSVDTASILADEIVAKAPLSVQYTKEVLRLVRGVELSEAISIEAKLQLHASGSEDHKEGRNAFIEKRRPIWSGC